MKLSFLPYVRREQNPEAPALSDDNFGRLSNAEFCDLVDSYARHFADRGILQGDVVAVKLTNRAELVVALFAAWRLRAAITPINPALTLIETSYQLQDSGAKLVIVEDASDGFPDTVAAVTLSQLAAPAPGKDLTALPSDLESGLDELALVIYTSGTTGRPKGVELLHSNLEAMTASLTEVMKLSEADHCLLILPLFHVNGIVVSVLCPLRAGGQVTVVGGFSSQRFFQTVETVRPTYFSAVPAIYAILANLPSEVRPDTSSLRFMGCGASPMPPQLIEKVERRFGVQIVEGYGLSESTCASTMNVLDGVRKPGTVGVALPGQKVAIMNEEDQQVTDGGLGEVVIAGPTVMRGYLNKPEETAKTIRDGWLHTGDVGRLDEDGYLYLVDRVKDMIIRGGENIYPKEIETGLHDHPAVLEAAVVGQAHEVMGEVPVAFISFRAGAELNTAEVQEFLRSKLAAYKIPVDVITVGELPKNPVGKIDKPALRRRLLEPVS